MTRLTISQNCKPQPVIPNVVRNDRQNCAAFLNSQALRLVCPCEYRVDAALFAAYDALAAVAGLGDGHATV